MSQKERGESAGKPTRCNVRRARVFIGACERKINRVTEKSKEAVRGAIRGACLREPGRETSYEVPAGETATKMENKSEPSTHLCSGAPEMQRVARGAARCCEVRGKNARGLSECERAARVNRVSARWAEKPAVRRERQCSPKAREERKRA